MKFLTERDFRRIKRIGEMLLIIGLLCLVLGLIWREYIVVLSALLGTVFIVGGLSYMIAVHFGKKSVAKAKERLRNLGIDPDEYC